MSAAATRLEREAWATSIAIHVWLLAMILWLLPEHKPPVPGVVPIELTTIDLGGPAGDRAVGHDLPAPKPLVHAHAHRIYRPQAVAEPRPLERHVAPIPHERRPAAPRIETQPQPNAQRLAAEEARQERMDRQLAEAASDAGSPQGAAAGTGKATAPVSGGAVSVGSGASGDLSGRAILSLMRADFPRSAEGRHAIGWRGTVTAALRVGPDGRVSGIQILHSSGDPDVDAAAAQAFSHWRFSPLPPGQPPVIQVGEVKMRFVLR